MQVKRQVRMVLDLNKCLGCHTCTMACKTMWTDRNRGQMHMYWNNVETHPGQGYPKDYENQGGWFNVSDRNTIPLPKTNEGFGGAWEYNYQEVLRTEGGEATASVLSPFPAPSGKDAYGSNWDEDVGAGDFPNSYYFYLPRICNHCSDPPCVDSCPRQAVYKREEDGIVLVDQNRCRGYRYCIKGCPYKKIYYNPLAKMSQKCVFCYPRIEQHLGPFCAVQCPGRVHYVGYADDTDSNVYKLINVWKVALRQHPEWKTEPNVFYIPPFSPPAFTPEGKLSSQQRIPLELLAGIFGDDPGQTLEQRKERVQGILDLIGREREKVASGGKSELIDILIPRTEADRIQV